ncbi:hypothetical protein ACFVP3_33220 [Streptomyces sp. NPDC057806]|uniref:hypothetical protein n=1 Tax=Streptomyces sp. NPDC057806 TaxID=3346255 RepID=UPI0036CA08AB
MSDSLHELWLRGIAFNTAAPAEVLIRLLDEAAGEAGPLMCEGRDLPGAVFEAALRHPATRIRRALARNLHVDPARLAPLASDPSGLVRAQLAGGTRHQRRWVRPLPADILVTFLTAQDGGQDGRLTAQDIAGELWSSRQVPPSFPRDVADHDHPALRLYAAHQWQSLTAAQRTALLDDPDPDVREAAHRGNRWLDPQVVEAALPSLGERARWFVLGTCALSPAVIEQCFADDEVHPLARNRHTPADALARLARHPDTEIRRLVAARPDLAPASAAQLRQDPDEDVRLRARLQPCIRTWAEFETVDMMLGHCPDCTCPIITHSAEPLPDWYATCAASEEPALRRIAASWPDLPAQLVAALALDDDEEVLIRLACHHPLAPPHLLLDVFVTRPAHRPHLLTLPALPRTHLTHLIEHPDPQVRALAAADPALPHPPLQDCDPAVRQAAATNPALTPQILETLLTNPRTAQGAAANPSLPVARIHALLNECLHHTPTPRVRGGT